MVIADDMKKPEGEKVQNAKRAFIVGLFDLSWRMLTVMLVPIFIGLFIDSKFHKGQTFAIGGFFIGIAGGVYIIRSIVNKLSKGGDV